MSKTIMGPGGDRLTGWKAMWLLPFFMLTVLTVSARPQLRNLDIRVVLSANGDAHITETRQMLIGSEGTECYIVVGNLSGSEVSDLQVTDETGTQYENTGEWDINRSRREKQNRCGIVYKRSGYELCWGLGESGERTYITSYTVSRLLKGYEDADGFNYMFVAEDISPYPDHVRLTIVPADTTRLNSENTHIWGFRYKGEVNIIDGAIVAESSEPFSRNSAMVVMAAFDKGMFQPDDVRPGAFEEVKNEAFKDSDYREERSMWDKLIFGFFIGLWILIGLAPIIYTIHRVWKIWRAKRQINRNLMWYRDIPYEGDLLHANGIINAYKYVNANYTNLLSAYILRLIYKGALKVQQVTDGKGKSSQALVVVEQTDPEPTSDQKDLKLERRLHSIFKKAAGDDGILQAKELERYMEKYPDRLKYFVQLLHTDVSFDQAEHERKIGPNDRVSQLFGLRKFLDEFTLANERHVQEVALWKDYLIYATLFGNAEQVLKEMKEINPEYLKMDQVAQVVEQAVIIPSFTHSMNYGTIRAQQYQQQVNARRMSGGGGSVSWGGGGGFSGGGHGGGVR